MKNMINNRFPLFEYFNTANTKDSNADIAKYILENHESLVSDSLNHISKSSYFSQPTLSRFFLNTVLLLLKSIKREILYQI